MTREKGKKERRKRNRPVPSFYPDESLLWKESLLTVLREIVLHAALRNVE
jgi:hypothetical protein